MPPRSDRWAHREDAAADRRAKALSGLVPSLVGPRIGLGRFRLRQRPGVLRTGRDMTTSFPMHDGIQWTHLVDIATQGAIVLNLQREFYRGNQRWRRHIAKRILWHTGHIHHEGNAAAGPHVYRCPPAGDASQRGSH